MLLRTMQSRMMQAPWKKLARKKSELIQYMYTFAEIQSVEAVMAKVQEAQETVEEYTIKKGYLLVHCQSLPGKLYGAKEMNSDLILIACNWDKPSGFPIRSTCLM